MKNTLQEEIKITSEIFWISEEDVINIFNIWCSLKNRFKIEKFYYYDKWYFTSEEYYRICEENECYSWYDWN